MSTVVPMERISVERVEPAIAGPSVPPLPVVDAVPAESEALPPIAETLPDEPVANVVTGDSLVVVEENEYYVLVAPTASRRLAESLVLFIAAILFLRAMAVEPFGVPTGSMAPSLIGNHKCLVCTRCGYLVRVGESDKHQPYPKATCPNCGKLDLDMNNGAEIAGDRLLVDKNVYNLRKPHRWEIAVFRCPSDMTKPYVKRVIGLPGEQILVQDGDIMVNGQLARKTLTQCRETRVLVFDMNHPPKPDGWIKRWVIESKLPPAEGEKNDPTLTLVDHELRLDAHWATRVPIWIAYKHQRYDPGTGLDREDVIRDTFIYNGPGADDRPLPVHDFTVEFDVEIIDGSGQLLCRIGDGLDQLVATCPVGAPQDAQLRQENFGIVRSVPRKPLQAKKTYKVEMAFVDRRVSFAIDDREVFTAYDLDPVFTRPEVHSPFALGVQGINVVVRNLKIYRDIYYRASGDNAVKVPYQLGRDEYFMMGDNSANSNDSRSWPIPGVPERNFLGKPFLLHQPSRITHWTIGGRERVFQSIDWSRIRFLR
ncbi:MAG: signal peptidase I [Planctomycetes bacterium]|nr:signal peptidase I [Planctomycetota bacterium]